MYRHLNVVQVYEAQYGIMHVYVAQLIDKAARECREHSVVGT